MNSNPKYIHKINHKKFKYFYQSFINFRSISLIIMRANTKPTIKRTNSIFKSPFPKDAIGSIITFNPFGDNLYI